MSDTPTRTLAGAKVVALDEVLASADPAAGRYVEQGAIGHGGMGEVVLCVDRDIRRPVAMKRMLPATAEDPARRARFIEEAQVTGQLEHPNIVPVYELTRQPDGSVYYTMKLVKGKSLAEIIKEMRAGEPPLGKGGFPLTPSPKPSATLSELLQIFLKVCDGVAFAHSRGVIHRDLKPANIMVGDYGEVLVMDWGLAKIARRDDVGGASAPRDTVGQRPPAIGERGAETPRPQDQIVSDRQEMSAVQTMAGSMMGSPGYMSPEQAKGELDKMDARSDIFSLGAILYEILTLERAIAGDTAYAILANTLKGNIVPPEQRAPTRQVPRELSAIAMKCLHKGRAHRYRSVLDLKRDLTLFLEGRSVSASPDTFSQAVVKLVKRNKGVSISMAAAAVVLLAVGVFSYVRIVSALDRAVVGEARAKTNEQAAVAAQQQQRATALAASERFAKQAVRSAEFYRWEEAEQRAADAEAVCPDGPWADYARGCMAQLRGEHHAAIKLFGHALKIDPSRGEVKAALERSTTLLERVAAARKALKDGGKLEDWRVAEKLGDTFSEVENWREAERAYAQALQLMSTGAPREDVEYKLGSARAWIACEGFHESIRGLPPKEQLARIEATFSDIHGLPIRACGSRIEGGKLVFLDLKRLPVAYLQPLKGLELAELFVMGTKVADLAPLRGMPLTHLYCAYMRLSDLSPLKGMPLTLLECFGTRVSDLSPLKGMKLAWLRCGGTQVSNLAPLKGMPLTYLDTGGTRVSDLGPLKGMPLTFLSLGNTGVSDLTPLAGMPLETLECPSTLVADLGPLRGMPLKDLNCFTTRISDLGPLRGLPIKTLNIENCRDLKDVTPLADMELERLTFSPKLISKGMGAIRGMKSLKELCVGKPYTPEEFWRKYDAGEFK